MVKILIVEDHRSFRETLKECLNSELSWMMLEEAANGREAKEKVGSFLTGPYFYGHLPARSLRP